MAQARILLVEDNDDNLELMRFLLERMGHMVLPAFSGEECLRLAASEKPELILMDLALPTMDGWAAAEQLKANPATKDIPLVAITAYELPGDSKRALESGFKYFLSKPIDVPNFDEVITAALARR